MTVAELIRELQALPNQRAPVRVLMDTVIVIGNHEPYEQPLWEGEALEADEVRNMGPWVLVRSK